MESKFCFYEIVKIVPMRTALSNLVGMEGAILGKAKNNAGIWTYSVYVYAHEKTVYCLETELEATGKMDSRETFYSGETAKVVVNPTTGEGELRDIE